MPSKMPSGGGSAGASLQVFFKLVRKLLLRESDVRFQFPWLELVGVNGLSRVVLCKPCAKVMGGLDVRLLGVVNASKDVHVEHPSSLPSSFGGLDTARLRLRALEWVE
jgi:hypothetical protein